MIKLEDVLAEILGTKKAKSDKIDYIPYGMPDSKGLINASVPLTRRERRALKRKEKKHGR